MPAQRFRPVRSSAFVLGIVLLAGCTSMASIDWKNRGGAGPSALDASPLATRVADVLAATPMTMNEQIKVVSLRDNRIRLTGLTSNEAAASEAVRITQEVDGVDGVVDTISVR